MLVNRAKELQIEIHTDKPSPGLWEKQVLSMETGPLSSKEPWTAAHDMHKNPPRPQPHGTQKNQLSEPGAYWLMPVIPATQEAEIRRITVWSQTLSQKKKKKSQKKVGGVAQGIGPEFKLQYKKKN
jgi:hypothetical protein